uniref:Uncharacterized protein n=1 Tax=Micrurus corallinus TaxID=54390 RepID=A0A2D4ENV6_MICCO
MNASCKRKIVYDPIKASNLPRIDLMVSPRNLPISWILLTDGAGNRSDGMQRDPSLTETVPSLLCACRYSEETVAATFGGVNMLQKQAYIFDARDFTLGLCESQGRMWLPIAIALRLIYRFTVLYTPL